MISFSNFNTYFVSPFTPIFVMLLALFVLRVYKDTYLKEKIGFFNLKISKYIVGLVVIIFYIMIFSIIWIVNVLTYFSILNIASSELNEIGLWEDAIIVIFGIFAYILFDKTHNRL